MKKKESTNADAQTIMCLMVLHGMLCCCSCRCSVLRRSESKEQSFGIVILLRDTDIFFKDLNMALNVQNVGGNFGRNESPHAAMLCILCFHRPALHMNHAPHIWTQVPPIIPPPLADG